MTTPLWVSDERARAAATVVLVLLVVGPSLLVAGRAASTATEALAYAVLLVASTALLFSLPRLAWVAWLQVVLVPVAVLWVGFVWFVGDAPRALTFHMLRATSVAEMIAWLESRVFVVLVCIGLWIGAIGTALALERAPELSSGSKKNLFAIGLFSAMCAFVWHALMAASSTQRDDAIEVASRSAWPSGLLLTGIEMWQHSSSAVHRTAVSDPVRPLPFVPLVADAAKPGVRVLFVIGESHRADVMSPTARPDLAPGLRRRLDSGHLVEFSDMISASNLTVFSVPAMVTGTPSKELLSGVHKKPSGLGYFHKAGFLTAWLSNHSDDYFSEEGWDVASYPASLRYVPHDNVLLSKLRQVLNFGRDHTAVVLHMMGSHFDYEHRYPANFRTVPPSSLHRSAYLRKNYENSVAYSAEVLESILNMSLATPHPAVVIFSSDHGENLLDDERQLIWHGGVMSPSQFEFRSAMWIAWNDAWAVAFPHLVSQLKDISQAPLSHEHLLKMWLTAGGLLDGDGRQMPSVMTTGRSELSASNERIVYFSGRTARLGDLR